MQIRAFYWTIGGVVLALITEFGYMVTDMGHYGLFKLPITELLDCYIIGQLVECVDIGCELKIILWSRLDVHRAEYKHLVGAPRIQYLRNRFSASNRRNLILI